MEGKAYVACKHVRYVHHLQTKYNNDPIILLAAPLVLLLMPHEVWTPAGGILQLSETFCLLLFLPKAPSLLQQNES